MKKGFLLGIQFFTIIPYHSEIPWNPKTISWCLRLFPFIGLLIGSISVLQAWVLTEFSPVSILIIAFWFMFFQIALTGGLHLDGFMDSSDAFFSYRSRERRLEIMEDPRVGSFAVLSILFLLAFRFLFIFESLQHSLSFILIAGTTIPILSRWMIVFLLLKGKLAKETGLAASFQRGSSARTYRLTSVFVLFLLILLFILQSNVWIFVSLGIATIMYLIASNLFIKKHFGGITGDTLGATLEGGETFLWLVVWLLHFFVTV
jgi:adenosylcobinamide-GDP ribazoletransferase